MRLPSRAAIGEARRSMRAWVCFACLVAAAAPACGPPTSTSTHGTSLPPPKPKPPKLELPGSCVDPERDARTRLGTDAQGDGLRVERNVDLDDDGVVDPFVTHEVFCGTGGCDWHLYVQRGACAHHVGELFVVLPLATKTKRFGLVDLTGTVRKGCAGMARTDVVASFDGARYRVVRERKCDCPDEDHPGVPDPDTSCEDWHAPAGKTP